MLWRPHDLEIKKIQQKLRDTKCDERKLLFKIEELVQKYKEQCLPKKERKKYSQQTPLNILREDYYSLKLHALRPQVLKGFLTIDEAKKEATEVRDSEFQIVHDTGNYEGILAQLNSCNIDPNHKSEKNVLPFQNIAPKEDKKMQQNIYENILNARRFNMIRRQQKEKKRTQTFETTTSNISYSELG